MVTCRQLAIEKVPEGDRRSSWGGGRSRGRCDVTELKEGECFKDRWVIGNMKRCKKKKNQELKVFMSCGGAGDGIQGRGGREREIRYRHTHMRVFFPKRRSKT